MDHRRPVTGRVLVVPMSTPCPRHRAFNTVAIHGSRVDRSQAIRRTVRQVDALQFNVVFVETRDDDPGLRAVIPIGTAEDPTEFPYSVDAGFRGA